MKSKNKLFILSLSVGFLFSSCEMDNEPTNPNIKLDTNGITIQCGSCKVGEKGFINGIEYEAVDNDLLRKRRDEGADMTKLCTSKVTDMKGLFRDSDFNQPIGNWDVSNVRDMKWMFAYLTEFENLKTSFNQSIEFWDVGNVTEMTGMFSNSSFNQPIGNWDVSNVTDMSRMFQYSDFNQPIGNWNVSNVKEMRGMFSGSGFNQPIYGWNVGSVIDMQVMFESSSFNQPIENWNVSNVTYMNGMFSSSKFNQPIGSWNVSNVTDMKFLFHYSPFNQNISKWCVFLIKVEPPYFSTYYPINDESALSPENKPKWGTCPD